MTGDGRNQVVSLTTIDTGWGNAIADRTVQSYASQADRAQQWAAPRNGSMSYTADTDEFWVFRGGVWSRLPAGYVGGAMGPAVTTDAGAAYVTLVQYNFAVKQNRHYLVNAHASGYQVTAGNSISSAVLQDDQGGSQWCCYSSSLPVGYSQLGSTSVIYTPTSTKTAWVRIQAVCAAAGGAYRFNPNSCRIFVTDVGGV
jgi:hypothetical protein